jgi:hypothetical protein
MKTLLILLSVSFSAQCLAAPYAPPPVPNPNPDPFQSERFHCLVEKFNFTKNRYETEKSAGLLSDGNPVTGAQFEGPQQFVLELAKPENIQRISLIGLGSARFTISVATEKSTAGAAWQQVVKNAPLSAQWGGDRPINLPARFILIETDTPTKFNLNEFAVYGKLAPIAARRYLADVWNNGPSEEPLAEIGEPPKKSRRASKVDTTSNLSAGQSVIKNLRRGGSGAQRGY